MNTEIFRFGNPDAAAVLIQPVDAREPAAIKTELAAIQTLTDTAFCLTAVRVDHWNTDLSPWEAPAVFGSEGFGEGAADTLHEILKLTADPEKTYFIGGYSLAGLFALWAAHQTDVFMGTAAASPSVWFPGFTEYMKAHSIRSQCVYLSLGDKEAKTRNAVMASVENKIREVYDLLNGQGVRCVLEHNPGNHFRDAELRTAKAFAWVMQSHCP